MLVEAQGTALARGLASCAQAIGMTLKPGVIRPGLRGQVQNVVLCSGLSWDEQLLEYLLKGTHDQVCVSEAFSRTEVWS